MSYNNLNQDYRRDMLIEPAQLKSAYDIFHPHAAQRYMHSCKLEFNDGKIFRYLENGGIQLGKALMNQQAAPITNWVNQVQTTGTATVIGDKRVTVYTATAPVANEWDNARLLIRSGTGLGEEYLIKSHTVPAAGAFLTTIDIADTGGIRVATAVTSYITVVKNLYKDVIVHPVSTPTGIAVGVSRAVVPINYFFWAQRRGECPMLVDNGDSPTVGLDASFGAGTAGGFGNRATTKPSWGTIMEVGASDMTGLVYLKLE